MKKNQGIVNDVKLQEIFRDQGAVKKIIFLRAKDTGDWLIVLVLRVHYLPQRNSAIFSVLVITLTP